MAKLSTAERSARYRAKDVDGYRKRKAEWAKTDEQKKKRAAYMREWRARASNHPRVLAYARKYWEEHKEVMIVKAKAYHYKVKYGITAEQKLELIQKQDGKCAICAEVFKSPKSTHIDHCHSTKRIRGILCHICNTKLGWFERMNKSIIKYLQDA